MDTFDQDLYVFLRPNVANIGRPIILHQNDTLSWIHLLNWRGKVKVTVWHAIVITKGEVEVWHYLFFDARWQRVINAPPLASLPWSKSHMHTPEENKWGSWALWTRMEKRKHFFFLPGFESRAVHFVPNRYTDYTILSTWLNVFPFILAGLVEALPHVVLPMKMLEFFIDIIRPAALWSWRRLSL
jgi:hypothetical protein